MTLIFLNMLDQVTERGLDAVPSQRPLVSVLLIAYKQEHVIADAVRSVLAQTYSPLEILISDDCSPDRTFEVIKESVRDYAGPHRIVLNRNSSNRGISAHLSLLAQMSHGELLFVAAGDDISAPERCDRVVNYWLAHDCKPDLIATDLIALDNHGKTHEQLSPTNLANYQTFDDWVARRPHVVGASHTWTRRLFARFGDMMPGAMAEDQIMTFRAVMTGGALNLREPLVLYRHGGLSRKRHWNSVKDFTARIRQTNAFALAEITQLQQDAEAAGVGGKMREVLAPKLARENYTRDVFAIGSLGSKTRLMMKTRRVKLGFRIRMFLYAAFPCVYAPFFGAKRLLGGRRRVPR